MSMPARVTVLPATKNRYTTMPIKSTRKRRVAAYARVSTDSEEQMTRIAARDGAEYAEVFRTRWIPMEEKYFSAFGIKEKADLIL